MNNRSGAKRHYRPRACACGADAIYAVHVLARTIGPGQSTRNRKVKLSSSVILCGKCSHQVSAFVEDLGSLGIDALDQVRRPGPVHGSPSLFNETEA